MSRSEQHDILVVIRQRAKLAKELIGQRERELRAEFEKQLATMYTPHNNVTWEQLEKDIEATADAFNEKIRSDLNAKGVPEWAHPRVHCSWYSRGENMVKERRAELRKVAYTRIEALGKAARVEIERRSLDVQTELIDYGLQSESAKAWLEKVPSIKELMPLIRPEDIELLRNSEGSDD